MIRSEVKLAKEGFPIVLALLLLSIVFVLGAVLTHGALLKILVLIIWLLILFSFYFFRDPDRVIPPGDNLIISPADGKIIVVEKASEPEFLKTDVQKVSIFMSALDVHVNRIPIDGQVGYFNYKRGAYHPAYTDDASFSNEQTSISIENENVKILMRQIAGIFARRIVCKIREGTKVIRGERFGMIKFGSRLDLFLPLNVQVKVRLNQKVKAGETIIGTYELK